MRREIVGTDDLIAALEEGRPWVAHALVTTVTPVLLGYASLIGGGVSQADQEMAVEAAIARGVSRIDKFDPTRGTFAGWLRPFVRHAISDIRRQGRPVESLGSRDIPEPETNPQEQSNTEEQDAVARAVHQLRPTDELILRLRETEQLTYEQCAERIGGVTANACRVRHHRALRRLADLLSSEPALAHYFQEDTHE